MTVISRCAYVDGELMAPDGADILRTIAPARGGFPTLDIGCYHKFAISADGRTYAAAEDRVTAKLRRFYAIMNQVEGFATLHVRRTEGDVPATGGYTISYQIIYVVERTGSTTQDPESPYAGYQRDLRARRARPRPVETSGLSRC